MKRLKNILIVVCMFVLCAMTGLITACGGNGHTHDLTQIKEQAATCTQDGNAAYFKCDSCGKLFADAEAKNEITLESVTIQKLGHDITHFDANPATCTDAGNIECYACSRCQTCFTDETGTTVSEQEFVVNATGHDYPMAFIEAKAPTVSEEGHVAHYYCSKCERNFEDAYGDKELTDISIAPIVKIDEVTVVLNGYEEGQEIDLDGKTVTFTGPYSLSASGNVSKNSVVLQNVYALEYSVVCDRYVGTIAFENGKTDYVLRLEYPYAANTSNSATGHSYVDFTHMNDAKHTIKMSDAWGSTTKNYTEATLNLPVEIRNAKYATVSFTLKYGEFRFDSVARFGVKMADNTGVFVSVFSKNEMQVCVFGRDKADDTFDGYDNKNSVYAEKVCRALSGDGMEVRMVRANAKIRMFVNLDNEWVELINYQGAATCAANAQTDMRLLILAHEWEFSDIKYAVMEHEIATPPTTETAGNLEYYKVGDMYFNPDGTITTQEAVTLPVLTLVEVTLTVSGYRDGTTTPISDNVIFVNTDNGQNVTVAVASGSAQTNLYALTYDVTCGDYRGTVTVEEGKETYEVVLQYAYATATGVSNTGNSNVDLSKMNDNNHTIKMSDSWNNTTANYTEVALDLPNSVKNANKTSVSFTLKHIGGDFNTQANLARFGVKMAGGKGVYAFVNYEKTSVMANGFNNPNNMFDGEHNQRCDVNAFISALTGDNGMQVRVVRFGTTIRMFVKYGDSWVQLNQTATCDANAATDIRLLILAHEWEFSNIEYSLIEHVEAKSATEEADGCLEHYKVGDAYFNADGSLTTKEAVTLPKLVVVNASFTVKGYKDEAETFITGNVIFVNTDNGQNVTVSVTDGAATARLYAMTYEVSFGDYYFGMVIVTVDKTEYAVVLQYAYATDTGDSKTGNSSIDFSKMNESNHTIIMSDVFNGTTANYTEAKLNLPDSVKNANKTSVSFTLKHLGDFGDPHLARFGVKMSGGKGIFVSMHANGMQVCAFTKPDNMFDGWDDQNKTYTTAIRDALVSNDGLQVRVVRFGTTIRMFVKLNGTWVQLNQTATCEESAETDIRLLILAHEWEFSNIEYSVMEHVSANAPTTSSEGNIEYYQVGDLYFTTDGTLTTEEAVALPKLTTVDATFTVIGYKDGVRTALTGDVRFINSDNQKDFTVSVTGESATCTFDALTYQVTCGDYYGTVTISLDQTAYTIVLQYRYAEVTHNHTSGGASSTVDLSKMNDSNHTITINDNLSFEGTANYTEAQLKLPDSVKNAKYATVTFNLKYLDGSFDNLARVGVKMTGSNGMFLTVWGPSTNENYLHVCVFGRDAQNDMFNGWDSANNNRVDAVRAALSGEGLQIRMVRANDKIRMFVSLNGEWVELVNNNGVATCDENAETDIRLLVLKHGWEFSNIEYSVMEHVPANAPTTTNEGNKEYYKLGDMFFMPDGTLTTEENVTLPVLTTVEATLTVKLHKDGQMTELTGNVQFVNAENQKDFSVSVANGTATHTFDALTYQLNFTDGGERYIGTVSIALDNPSYEITLEYEYATVTHTHTSGGNSSTVDLSKMNDSNHTIKMNDNLSFEGTANYTEVQLKLPDNVKNAKNVSVTFTLKHIGGDFNTQANLARFGVKMAGGKGVYAFVNYEKTGVMANGFNNPNNMFDGESAQSCSASEFIAALTGTTGLQVRVIRNGVNIYMLVKYGDTWVRLTPLATCAESDKTDIRLLILAHEWEFSNIEYSATTQANVTHLGNEDAAWVDLTKYDNDKTITLTDMKWNGTDKYTEVQLILPENVKSAKNVDVVFTIKCVNDQAFNWGDPVYGNFPNLGRFGVKMAEEKGIFTYVNSDNKNIIEASTFNNPNNMFDGGGEVGQTGNAFLTAIQGGGLQVKVTRNGGTISMAIYLNDEWIMFSTTATCDENAETDIRLLTMAFGWEISDISVTVPTLE